MTGGFHGFAALRTERTSTGDNFHAPGAQGFQLAAGAPDMYYTGLLLIQLITQNFTGYDYDQIAVGIKSQSNFTYPEAG